MRPVNVPHPPEHGSQVRLTNPDRRGTPSWGPASGHAPRLVPSSPWAASQGGPLLQPRFTPRFESLGLSTGRPRGAPTRFPSPPAPKRVPTPRIPEPTACVDPPCCVQRLRGSASEPAQAHDAMKQSQTPHTRKRCRVGAARDPLWTSRRLNPAPRPLDTAPEPLP